MLTFEFLFWLFCLKQTAINITNTIKGLISATHLPYITVLFLSNDLDVEQFPVWQVIELRLREMKWLAQDAWLMGYLTRA